MAYSATSTLIKSFPLNGGKSIKVHRIKETNSGNESIGIRYYYTGKDEKTGQDAELPEKRGINIPSEVLPDIIAAVVSGMSSEELMEFSELTSEIK